MRDRLITSSSFKHGLTTLGFNLSDEVRRARLSSVWRAPSLACSVTLFVLTAWARQPRCWGLLHVLLRYRNKPLSIEAESNVHGAVCARFGPDAVDR